MSTLELEVGDLRAAKVEFIAADVVVTLRDGRRIATPISWYPKLEEASPRERTNYEILPMGIHWPDVDEDLSVAGMLAGNKAIDATPLGFIPTSQGREHVTAYYEYAAHAEETIPLARLSIRRPEEGEFYYSKLRDALFLKRSDLVDKHNLILTEQLRELARRQTRQYWVLVLVSTLAAVAAFIAALPVIISRL
jgi:hypothetical protein